MQDPCAVFLRTVKLRCIFAALPPFADAETSQTQDGAETRAPAESPRVASATGAQTGATTSRKRGRVQTGGRRAWATPGHVRDLVLAVPWGGRRARAALGKMPGGGAQIGHHEEQPRRDAGYGAQASD